MVTLKEDKYPKYLVGLAFAYIAILAITLSIIPPSFYMADPAILAILTFMFLPAIILLVYVFDIVKANKALRIAFIIFTAIAIFHCIMLSSMFF
jgi:hypothetical protein